MKLIGITGGIGAGKSEILSYIREHYNCCIILADEAAHQAEMPGEVCYEKLVTLLGRAILQEDGIIDKQKMAERIFGNRELLRAVNELIHPAVKEYILRMIREKREEGKTDFFFVEAALLIEEGYGQILDELWYIRAEETIRRERLRQSRNYSDEKIDSILSRQLPEEEFRKHCSVVIDNSASLEETYRQIDKILESTV